jgi:protein-disulfide isomerase
MRPADLAAPALAALLASAVTAAVLLSFQVAPPTPRSADEVGVLALEALRANPEVVLEALAEMRAREEAEAEAAATAALTQARDRLERDPNAPVAGNPDGDVTVVEFFDYNCPYCRRAGDEIAALKAADPDVRVVYREWPILGEGSDIAARAALAAREQGLYQEMHEALMAARGRLDERSVMQIAAGVGLDLDMLRSDMSAPAVQAHIDGSMELARALGFTGTPSFVIGEERANGLVPADRMQQMVAAARDDG